MKVTWEVAMRGIAKWVVAGTGLPNAQVFYTGQGGKTPAYPYVVLDLPSTRGFGSDWTRIERSPLVIPDDVVEAVDTIANTLQLTAHGLVTGDGPIRFVTTDTLPAGIALATDYWVVVSSANLIRLATSRAAAIDAVPVVVDITGVGVGVHTLQDTADTVRVGQEIKHIVEGSRSATITMQCFADTAFGAVRAQAVLEKMRTSITLPAQKQRLREIGFGIGTIGEVVTIPGSTSGDAAFEPRATFELRLHYIDSASELGTNIEVVEVTGNVKTVDEVALPPIVFQVTGE